MKPEYETYADHMRKAMREKTITLRDIASASHYSYEHLRKIRQGRSLLSREASDVVCAILGLDKQAMWALVSTEKIKHRFGDVPAELVPAPDDRMARHWSVLTPAEQQQIVAMVETLARRHLAVRDDDSEEELVAVIAKASELLVQIQANKVTNLRRQRLADASNARGAVHGALASGAKGR
jgi:hypothetical protein